MWLFTKAEYKSVSQALTKIVWIKSLLYEIKLNWFSVPLIWCDNMSTRALASNALFHSKTKHIEIDVHYVRKQIVVKRLNVQYIPIEH